MFFPNLSASSASFLPVSWTFEVTLVKKKGVLVLLCMFLKNSRLLSKDEKVKE